MIHSSPTNSKESSCLTLNVCVCVCVTEGERGGERKRNRQKDSQSEMTDREEPWQTFLIRKSDTGNPNFECQKRKKKTYMGNSTLDFLKHIAIDNRRETTSNNYLLISIYTMANICPHIQTHT